MQFCGECDSLLKTKEQGKYKCKCGAVYDVKPVKKKTRKMSAREKNNFTSIRKTVIIDEDYINLESAIEQYCPECNNNEAYLLQITPLYGDEENVTKYKCTKCKTVYSDGAKIT